ncbi:ribonuclease H-like domain-containing protein [Rhodothermus profundi]|uniref:Predicted 3'-5' exonuclease PolB-like domain-containing protein n=1 Tax=Rhodothermus profundi TaxID=633813 RepID=A0A1M6V3X7_9BACT|nr:ribonuclease H-like domain-containing protein [Rhodothermus profundi]SHK76197.1 hypothetical protein SAMN04488087_1893 [Rhodothermus profundi]
MHYLALDIETCPLPKDGYSEQQQARLAREMHFQRQREPDLPEDHLALRAASLHPLLSWIVCISVQRAEDDPSRPNPPYTYAAETPEEECGMLERFWRDIQRLVDRGEKICWITFNGKRFDVPFLLARTLHHGLLPVACGLLDNYPYRNFPHCDLFSLFWGINLGLEDLCALLHIPSPKMHGDGSLVYQLLKTEGIDGVRRYCEADVEATLKCFARLLPLLPRDCQPPRSEGK